MGQVRIFQVLILRLEGQHTNPETHRDCSILSPFSRAPWSRRCSLTGAPGLEKESGLASPSLCSGGSKERLSVRTDCNSGTTRHAAEPDLRTKMTSWCRPVQREKVAMSEGGEVRGKGRGGRICSCLRPGTTFTEPDPLSNPSRLRFVETTQAHYPLCDAVLSAWTP